VRSAGMILSKIDDVRCIKLGCASLEQITSTFSNGLLASGIEDATRGGGEIGQAGVVHPVVHEGAAALSHDEADIA
jgi:hypothetical protein